METEKSQKKAKPKQKRKVGAEPKTAELPLSWHSQHSARPVTDRMRKAPPNDEGASAASVKGRLLRPHRSFVDKAWLSHLKEAPAIPHSSSWDATADNEQDMPFREPSTLRNILRHRRLITYIFLASLSVTALFIFATGSIVFRLGMKSERKGAEIRAQIAKGGTVDAPEFTAVDEELSAALRLIYVNSTSRTPNLDELRSATATITALAEKHTAIAPLKYLAAVANLQASDLDEARTWAQRAIDSGSYASDAYATLAIIDGLPSDIFGSPSLQTRAWLEQAIAVDIANPSPRIELATQLRNEGKLDEAEQMYLSALVRLHPVDSHAITRTILRFIAIDRKKDTELQKSNPSTNDPEALMLAAYTALRFEDFELAEKLLERAQKLMQPNTFLYLMQDRGFMKYSYRPEIKRFTAR